MAVPRAVTTAEKLGDDGFVGQRTESDRRDEFTTGRRYDDLHFMTRFHKQADERASLVRGDTAGYAKDDMHTFFRLKKSGIRNRLLWVCNS